MATKKPSENKDAPLPLPDLSLLTPPLRLVSAAMWKVMKERDVVHYGTLEEFVTSSCEAVPGLLTSRHQAKLALGLRGRLILELCRGQGPLDPEAILPQLDRMRSPDPSSTAMLKRDSKVETALTNFRDLVHALLRDPVEREHFNEELHVDYGPQFDQELEKLLWEFLLRLDSLLPSPDLAQTVSWLIAAPAVREGCSLVPSQAQLLRTLFQHQNRLGHVGTAASLPPCVGDSIFNSLSLPPSGRVPETAPGCARRPPSRESGPPPETPHDSPSPLAKPAIGRMTNGDEDEPIASSARRRAGSVPGVSIVIEEEEEEAACSSKYTGVKQRSKCTDDAVREDDDDDDDDDDGAVVVDQGVRTRRNGTKRRLGDTGGGESEEDAAGRGRKRRILRSGARERGGGERGGERIGERGGERRGERGGESPSGRAGETKVGVMTRARMARPNALATRLPEEAELALRLPEEAELSSLALSCLRSRPRVLLHRLSPPTSATCVTSRSQGDGTQAARSPRSPQRHCQKQDPPSHPQGILGAQSSPMGPVISRQYRWNVEQR